MARSILPVALAAVSLFGGTDAQGCASAPGPVAPLYERYDDAVIATEFYQNESGALVLFEDAIRGRAPTSGGWFNLYRWGWLDLHHEGGGCGPGGFRPGRRERFVVYFKRFGGPPHIQRWAPLEEAAAVDPLVWVYMNGGGPRTPQLRMRLLTRAREVDQAHGPIPLTPAERWMAPYAGSLGQSEFGREFTRVQFDVAADGRMLDCRRLSSFAPDRTGQVCARIRHRGFRPPVLPHERHGVYEVRWNERAGTGG